MSTVGELTREELAARLAQALEAIDLLERENKILRDQLEIVKAGLFGRKSERIDPAQLALFAGDDSDEGEEEAETIVVGEHKRKRKKGNGRGPFPDHLPREQIDCDVPEEERICPDCGEEMKGIGEDICERGHFVPAQIIVRCYVKKKYACPKGHGVKTAEAPPSLIDRAKFEPSVYAHVAASKYCDHVPLNRMAGIFKRHGVHLPKQTMWEMLLRVYEIFGKAIIEQMRKEVLESPVLQGDETPVQVRLEDQKGTRKGYIWAWLTLTRKVLFVFTLTKEREGPIRFLGDWTGTAIFDGAPNFDEVVKRNKIIRAGCWSHARRKLKDALDRGSKGAARLLVPVQRLFRIERAIQRRAKKRELDEQQILELRGRVRARFSAKLLEKIDELMEELVCERGTLPKSLLGKALTYLKNQREPLRRFLDDPRLPIHNNASERALRHVAIGRKNWMVFGSPRGGEVASNLYSLMLSCRALGINPEAYLTDALERVATTPMSEIASLTPWAWAEAHPEARIAD